MNVLKSIVAIIIVAALFVGVIMYFTRSESDQTIPVGTIIINEFMASNRSFLPDELGSYSDWIEIYNPTDQDADLSGFGLSNDSSTVKWAFPHIILPSRSYLVVFASGKGTSDADAIYQHTNFKLNASKGGLYLMSTSGEIVDKIEYKDQIKNISLGRSTKDMTQWDLFEQPTPGFANDEAGYTAFMQSRVADKSTLLITEVMSSNKTTLADNSGNFYDYIELYNAGDKAVNLSGYGLSDDTGNVLKWRFPDFAIEAGAYLVVYASREDKLNTDISKSAIHTNFCISSYKETIVLSNPMGLILDQISVSEIKADHAYARVLDQEGYGTDWEMTSLPTPGFPNNEEGYASFQENK
ncbi:MAG: lamin tail domain-containing protein [Christensenellales bacterium]